MDGGTEGRGFMGPGGASETIAATFIENQKKGAEADMTAGTETPIKGDGLGPGPRKKSRSSGPVAVLCRSKAAAAAVLGGAPRKTSHWG